MAYKMYFCAALHLIIYNMRKTYSGFLALAFLLGGMLFSSCIREEAPNAECDIESCVLPVADPMSVFFHDYDTLQVVSTLEDAITFQVRHNADLTHIPLRLNLTPGATAYHLVQDAGAEQEIPVIQEQEFDFSQGPLRFRVRSEDRNWNKVYQIAVEPIIVTHNTVFHYDFEHFELDADSKKFYNWYEMIDEENRKDQWASGNPGFKLSKSSAKVEEYPTIPVAEGYEGYGVKLETRSTGGFGAMVNMRIAPGNLFIGTFDVANALKDAMAATRMGLPFNQKPLRLSGYYKFKPGKVFQDRGGKEVPGRVDQPDIYSVLYKNTDAEGNPVVLRGDDVLTHPNIVALARISDAKPCDEWTPFNLEYEYYGEVDKVLLMNFGYNLALVFTSSIEGASFCGAVGSILHVDQVRIDCEEYE